MKLRIYITFMFSSRQSVSHNLNIKNICVTKLHNCPFCGKPLETIKCRCPDFISGSQALCKKYNTKYFLLGHPLGPVRTFINVHSTLEECLPENISLDIFNNAINSEGLEISTGKYVKENIVFYIRSPESSKVWKVTSLPLQEIKEDSINFYNIKEVSDNTLISYPKGFAGGYKIRYVHEIKKVIEIDLFLQELKQTAL